jgi:hypothetical protein
MPSTRFTTGNQNPTETANSARWTRKCSGADSVAVFTTGFQCRNSVSTLNRTSATTGRARNRATVPNTGTPTTRRISSSGRPNRISGAAT